jgi:hypothetical protein
VGQLQFHARPDDRLLVFEIELWARTVDRLVHLLYTRLGLAKEVQLNMWVRFCLAVVLASGGRLWTASTSSPAGPSRPATPRQRDVRGTGGERPGADTYSRGAVGLPPAVSGY